MTTQARKVLRDLNHTYEMLEKEENLNNFRVLWLAAISLARAVGHMLDKVDSKQSTKMANIIHQKWQDIRENKEKNVIFFEFIKNERDCILKEYEFGILSIPVDIVVSNNIFSEIYRLENCLYVPLQYGRYEGEDCRDILKQAIIWWEEYLADIDTLYSQNI